MQQRRLACAIGAEDGEELARPHGGAHPVQNAPRAAHDTDIFSGQHQNAPFWRSSSHRKNGPPRRLVTMPIGSSAGTTMVRANRSANSTRQAPSSADKG